MHSRSYRRILLFFACLSIVFFFTADDFGEENAKTHPLRNQFQFAVPEAQPQEPVVSQVDSKPEQPLFVSLKNPRSTPTYLTSNIDGQVVFEQGELVINYQLKLFFDYLLASYQSVEQNKMMVHSNAQEQRWLLSHHAWKLELTRWFSQIEPNLIAQVSQALILYLAYQNDLQDMIDTVGAQSTWHLQTAVEKKIGLLSMKSQLRLRHFSDAQQQAFFGWEIESDQMQIDRLEKLRLHSAKKELRPEQFKKSQELIAEQKIVDMLEYQMAQSQSKEEMIHFLQSKYRKHEIKRLIAHFKLDQILGFQSPQDLIALFE